MQKVAEEKENRYDVMHSVGQPILCNNVDLLEKKRRIMKVIRGLKHLSYKNGLRELGMFNIEKRSLQGDFIVKFST